MDIPRPQNKRKKQLRRFAYGAGLAMVLIVTTVGLARLEPAAPTVARDAVWVGTVERGEMLRQVRGSGVLVPSEIRWIAAQTDGRVERILVRPGAEVGPDTVLMELSNPDLLQQTEEARFALEAAEAEYTELELRLRSQQLDQRAELAVAQAEHESARLQAEAEQTLSEENIIPAIQFRRSQLLTDQLAIRVEIEQDRLNQFQESMSAQLTSQKAKLEQVRNTLQRRLEQVESLHVRAGISGVLQEVPVEEGERVSLGTNIARVARPDELQAELRVPESQASDVMIGQTVRVDTRNGIIDGRVARIDPGVRGGTVLVEVELTSELPRGARPDLSVDGIIEIERLEDVLYTGRPAYGQPHSTVSLFRLDPDDRSAIRVPVELGRSSVNSVEIVQGLESGDRVILSDTTAWSDHDRIKLD